MLVKVASCKDAFEGEVVKGFLADNGIECYLQNENMSQIYGGIQAMEINVLVSEEDAENARELLNARPKEDVKPDMPQWERKSVKRILLESLLFTIFAFGILLLSLWLGNNITPSPKYFLYAGGIFIGFFLLDYFVFRKTPKKEN